MLARERSIGLIGQDRCPCPACAGSLTDADRSPNGWRFCQICRCAWKVEALGSAVYACRVAGAKHPVPRPASAAKGDQQFPGDSEDN